MNQNVKGFGARGWILMIYQFLAYIAMVVFTNWPMNALGSYYDPVNGTQGVAKIYTMAAVVGVVLQVLVSPFIGKIKSIYRVSIVMGILSIVACFGVMMCTPGTLWNVAYFFACLLVIIWATFIIGILIGQWFPRRKGTVMGVILSTMHQSSLGSLFLIAPSKLHPLWYSAFLPVFFFVSSMAAGLSMVIFEGTLAHKALHHKMDETHLAEADGVVLGLGRACSVILAGYFMMKIMDIGMDHDWHWLFTGYGAWFCLELIGFVAVPCMLYAMGARERKTCYMRWAAALTVGGIIMNRFNVSMVAFNWQLPSVDRYFPSFLEVMLSVFIVTCIITAYRFIAAKMPMLYELKEFKSHH